MQKWVLLIAIHAGMAVLLGYMELEHEFERIGPETVLVTDHFTGRVQDCRLYQSGDMNCHDTDIEPRAWIFALVPFWPAREELDREHRSEAVTRETQFTQSQLFKDILSNGFIVVLMAGITILVMRIKDDDDDSNAEASGNGGGGGFGRE